MFQPIHHHLHAVKNDGRKISLRKAPTSQRCFFGSENAAQEGTSTNHNNNNSSAYRAACLHREKKKSHRQTRVRDMMFWCAKIRVEMHH